MNNIKDLNISLTDRSVKEYSDELLEQLEQLNNNFSTHAMSDHMVYLQGQKNMLEQLITYIKRTQ